MKRSIVFQRALEGKKKGPGRNVDAGYINRVVYRKHLSWSWVGYAVPEAVVFYSPRWHAAICAGLRAGNADAFRPGRKKKKRVVPLLLA